MKKIIYAGTYTARASKGIYSFVFEDGLVKDPSLLSEIHNPKYLCMRNNRIITVCDTPQGSGAAILNEKGEILDQIAFEDGTSCFVTERDDRVYCANYHTGSFSMLELHDDTFRFVRTIQIQDGGGCHQVLVWKDMILVPCLFLDRVMIYDSELNKKGSIRFNQGTGPRHGVFTKDGEYLYLVSELSNELFVIHTGDWKIEAQISVLPEGRVRQRDTAAIRLSEDEKYIYVSTRTLDILSVIEVKEHKPELIQAVFCGGKHPRDFILIDHYLLCANRNSDEVVCLEIHDDGTIGRKTSSVNIPEVVSLTYMV